MLSLIRQQYVTHPVGQMTLEIKVRIERHLRGKNLYLQGFVCRKSKRKYSLIHIYVDVCVYIYTYINKNSEFLS